MASDSLLCNLCSKIIHSPVYYKIYDDSYFFHSLDEGYTDDRLSHGQCDSCDVDGRDSGDSWVKLNRDREFVRLMCYFLCGLSSHGTYVQKVHIDKNFDLKSRPKSRDSRSFYPPVHLWFKTNFSKYYKNMLKIRMYNLWPTTSPINSIIPQIVTIPLNPHILWIPNIELSTLISVQNPLDDGFFYNLRYIFTPFS